MLAIITLVAIISVLVIIHELGHFFTAKKFGVKVEEFGFGLPPKLFGKRYKGTHYTFNLLPFGGFVRLFGEDAEDANAKDPKNFMSKTPLQRGVILIAGVLMNFALAVVLFYLFFFMNNFKSLSIPIFFDFDFRFGTQNAINTVVTALEPGKPAEVTGVELGEAIIEIDGVPVYTVSDIRRELEDNVGVKTSLLLMDVRNPSKDIRTETTIPEANADGDGIIGVVLTKAVVLSYEGRQRTFAGPLHAYNMLSYTSSTLGRLIGLSVETKSVEPVSGSVAGPVGIFSVVGGILNYQGSRAFLGLLDLTALLSLSLGFLNLLPFPALDGGRLTFVIIEGMRGGKKVNPAVEHFLHKWGIVILLTLMVLVTIRDISNILG